MTLVTWQYFSSGSTGGGPNRIAIAPNDLVWVSAVDNHLAPQWDLAGIFRFQWEGSTAPYGGLVELLPIIDLNCVYGSCSTSYNALPYGVSIDGEGKAWTTVNTPKSLYVRSPAGTSFKVPVGANPLNIGDTTGHLQAYIILPDADFDGDGVANRAELLAGTNPFLP
jgi:hypothetical protein